MYSFSFQICLQTLANMPFSTRFKTYWVFRFFLPVKVIWHRQQATSHSTCDTLNKLILPSFSLQNIFSGPQRPYKKPTFNTYVKLTLSAQFLSETLSFLLRRLESSFSVIHAGKWRVENRYFFWHLFWTGQKCSGLLENSQQQRQCPKVRKVCVVFCR